MNMYMCFSFLIDFFNVCLNFKPYFYEYTDVFNLVQKATQIYKPQIQFI